MEPRESVTATDSVSCGPELPYAYPVHMYPDTRYLGTHCASTVVKNTAKLLPFEHPG